MKYVSTAELKAKLSKYLGMVREGQTVYVTHHQQPVAELSALKSPGELDIIPPKQSVSTLSEIKGIHRPEVDPLSCLMEDRSRR